MPMSPRLLRPRASGLVLPSDADARAYVLAVNTADGQPLEAPVVQAIDAFVVGCKADGIWSAIKASCLLMGARTLSGALTPLAGTAPTSVNFVAGDYNRKTGLKGDGTTKYLDSNRNNNADPQNNNHNAIYVSEMNASGVAGPYMTAAGFGEGANNIARSSAGEFLVFVRNRSVGSPASASVSLSGTGSHVGFVGASRAASSTISARASGTSFTESLSSAATASGNVRLYNRVDGLFSNGRLAFYSIGESLALSSLDSRVTTLYNAIGAAIP